MQTERDSQRAYKFIYSSFLFLLFKRTMRTPKLKNLPGADDIYHKTTFVGKIFSSILLIQFYSFWSEM